MPWERLTFVASPRMASTGSAVFGTSASLASIFSYSGLPPELGVQLLMLMEKLTCTVTRVFHPSP